MIITKRGMGTEEGLLSTHTEGNEAQQHRQWAHANKRAVLLQIQFEWVILTSPRITRLPDPEHQNRNASKQTVREKSTVITRTSNK
jgi:hypothetical protein